MRRKVLVIAAAAVAGMLLLTACTSSENKDMQEAGAGVSGGVSGTASQSSTAAQESDTSADQEDTEQTGQEVAGIPVSGTSTGSDTAGGSSSTGGSSSVSGSTAGTASGEYDGAYQTGSQDGGSGSETGDIWTGVYGNDSETLTITYVDEETISFTFAQSGIYGKAEVNGYQAVYKGDDYHVVVFNIHDDIVDVSVSSEEDYDTSGSPLIGTYVKDYVSGSSEAATEEGPDDSGDSDDYSDYGDDAEDDADDGSDYEEDDNLAE